jgi:hypothetical protein
METSTFNRLLVFLSLLVLLLLVKTACDGLSPSGPKLAAGADTEGLNPIVLLDSGVGDSEVLLMANPVNSQGVPPTAPVTTTVGNPTGWFPPCGSSKVMGYTNVGKSPEMAVPFDYSYNRVFSVPTAMLAPDAGTFNLSYKADDDARMSINGHLLDVCLGNNSGGCFNPGCRNVAIPLSDLSATSTLVMEITDSVYGSTCFCCEVTFTPGNRALADQFAARELQRRGFRAILWSIWYSLGGR